MFYAHAFGQRYELPLPLIGFIVGGAVVVIVSFLLIAGRPVAKVAPPPVVEEAGTTRPVWAPATIALLILAGLIAAGTAGSQELAENIVPTTFWVVLWIVVPLSCGFSATGPAR